MSNNDDGDTSTTVRDKGKGRMSEVYQELSEEEGEDEEREPATELAKVSIYPPELGNEEEREEKRIADNLALWSKSDKRRRAEARRSMPTALVIPALPSIIDLSRRVSSTRKGASLQNVSRTSSRSSQDSREGSRVRDEERSMISPQSESVLSPKNKQRSKMDTFDEVDVGQDSNLNHERNASTSTHQPLLRQRPDSITLPTIPFLPSISNPFLTPNFERSSLLQPLSDASTPSYQQLAVNNSNSTPPTSPARSSRFIEHLPPQSPTKSERPPSCVGSSFTSSTASSSLSPTKRSQLPHSNPFADRYTTRDNIGPTGRDRSNSRMSYESHESMNSESTVRMLSGRRDDSSQAGTETSGMEGLMEGARGIPLTKQRQDLGRNSGGFERDEAERKEREEEDSVGWLELFFCGCWGREDRGSGREQEGRTNPNE